MSFEGRDTGGVYGTPYPPDKPADPLPHWTRRYETIA